MARLALVVQIVGSVSKLDRSRQRGQASQVRSNALRINAAHDQERTLRVGAASSETTPAPTVPASDFSVGTLP